MDETIIDSQEETVETETTEEESSPSEEKPEKTVPLSRFNEVYGEFKTLQKEIADLKVQKKTEGLSPDEEKELQAKQYLEKLIEDKLEERTRKSAEREETEKREFQNQVDEVLDLNPAVDRKEFIKFMESGKVDAYGITTVKGAMQLYKDIGNLSKEEREKAKDEITKKPKLPKSDTSGGEDKVFDFKGKTLDQIAEESIRELDKK